MALIKRGGYDGTVHTAGEGEQNLLIAYLAADQLYLVGNEIRHVPVGLHGRCQIQIPFIRETLVSRPQAILLRGFVEDAGSCPAAMTG